MSNNVNLNSLEPLNQGWGIAEKASESLEDLADGWGFTEKEEGPAETGPVNQVVKVSEVAALGLESLNQSLESIIEADILFNFCEEFEKEAPAIVSEENLKQLSQDEQEWIKKLLFLAQDKKKAIFAWNSTHTKDHRLLVTPEGRILRIFNQHKNQEKISGSFKVCSIAQDLLGNDKTFASLSMRNLKDTTRVKVAKFIEETNANEIENLKAFAFNPCFVRGYLAISYTNKKGVFKRRVVVEYFNGPTLSKLTEETSSILVKMITTWQLAHGLQQLDQTKSIHRDIKPDNLLFTQGEAGDSSCAFGDLGSLLMEADKQAPLKKQQAVTTPFYASPELAKAASECDQKAIAEATNHKLDIWSAGVTFYELWTDNAELPWSENTFTEVAGADISKIDWTILEANQVDPKIIGLIQSMLSKEPAKRPTGQQVLDIIHPIFKASLDAEKKKKAAQQ